MALVLSLEVLHTALVIDMIPLHSLLRILTNLQLENHYIVVIQKTVL